MTTRQPGSGLFEIRQNLKSGLVLSEKLHRIFVLITFSQSLYSSVCKPSRRNIQYHRTLVDIGNGDALLVESQKRSRAAMYFLKAIPYLMKRVVCIFSIVKKGF